MTKVAGVKVHLRQTWNFRSHAVSAYISLWHHRLMHAPHRLMHAPHRLMHACAACIAPWHHGPMHAVTAWALLFWFCLRYTLTSSYFVRGTPLSVTKKKVSWQWLQPEEIGDCSSLIDLYVGANELKCLPRSITNLTRLAHLCASINQGPML